MIELTRDDNQVKGFHIKLDNGYSVSVQFGSFNYCSNRNMPGQVIKADTVETAILDPQGEFVKYKGDEVQGWQTANEVADAINYAKSL